MKNDIIWSEIRPGLENRAAHPHREFPGVPPAPPPPPPPPPPREFPGEPPPPPPRALLIIKEDYKIMISPNFTRNPRRLLFPVYVFQCCHDTSHLFEASKRCQSNILRTCRLCCLRYAFPRSKFSAAKWITIAFLSGRSNQQEKRPVVGI